MAQWTIDEPGVLLLIMAWLMMKSLLEDSFIGIYLSHILQYQWKQQARSFANDE